MLNDFYEKLSKKENKMIEIRRYLHEHPELSFEEKETAQYIADFYKDKDVTLQTHIGGEGIYGIKVTIDSGKPGKTLALRADFDALPIKKIPAYLSVLIMRVSCMLVVMTRILLI